MAMRAFAILTVAMVWAGCAGAQPLRISTPLLTPDVDNPYEALSLPSAISSQVMFDPLVVIDGDGLVQPWLLTEWTTDDSLVWRFTVRDGVLFSNGVPLTSDAIVQSVAYMQTPEGRTKTIGGGMVNIDRAVAVSEQVVEIILKSPDPMLPLRLAGWRLPEPETWWVRSKDPNEMPAANTGPFTMVDKNAARAIYVANPTAWNPPLVERLEIVQSPDQTARLQALMADAADIALQMGIGDRDSIQMIGGETVQRKTTRINYMTFTTEHVDDGSPIHDPRVRLAMNYAVDRQRIADLLLDGRAIPVGQLALPGAAGYVDEIGPYPYDPDQARTLLAEAGYADGLELSIRVSTAGADDLLVYQQAAEDLRAVGIKLNLLSASPAQMTLMMFGGDLKAEMFGNYGRGLDPLGDYRYRACLGQTGSNKPYYCDPVSLEYVRQAQQATSLAEVDRLMQLVTRREYEAPPGVFLWQGIMVDGLGPRIASAEDYSNYYDYIPYHAIALKDD